MKNFLLSSQYRPFGRKDKDLNRIDGVVLYIKIVLFENVLYLLINDNFRGTGYLVLEHCLSKLEELRYLQYLLLFMFILAYETIR